jgi:hypothetical protein
MIYALTHSLKIFTEILLVASLLIFVLEITFIKTNVSKSFKYGKLLLDAKNISITQLNLIQISLRQNGFETIGRDATLLIYKSSSVLHMIKGFQWPLYKGRIFNSNELEFRRLWSIPFLVSAALIWATHMLIYDANLIVSDINLKIFLVGTAFLCFHFYLLRRQKNEIIEIIKKCTHEP